jgi:uncharacterized protein YbjT (DUF2867 family)
LAILSLEKEEHENYKVRAIVQDDRNTEELRKKGAEVVKIDYNRRETIETALGGCHWLVFVAELEDRSVDKARTLADAAKRVRLPNIVITSLLGTGDSPLETFRNFGDIENALEGAADNWVTLRNALFHQRLWHWVPRIKENGVLILSTHDDSRFSPLSLDDLVFALDHIILEDNGRPRGDLERKHCHRRYTLTGPELVTGPLIVDMINEAIDEQAAVKFMSVTPEELDRYLSSLSHKQSEYVSMDGRKRHNIKYPSLPAPNKQERRMILDVFEYVTQGKAGFLSGDQRAITGADPERLTYFFKEHRDSFRPDNDDNEYRRRNRDVTRKGQFRDRSDFGNARDVYGTSQRIRSRF